MVKTKLTWSRKPIEIGNDQSFGKVVVIKDKEPKTLLECGVCWGGGEIDINDDMETVKCWNCNGSGVVKNY